MASGLIDPGGATQKFDDMVNNMVEGFKANWHHVRSMQGYSGFYVPTVTVKNGQISYWGILDIENMAEEDIYIEVWRRFFSAVDHLGERNITGFGIVDLNLIVQVVPKTFRTPKT